MLFKSKRGWYYARFMRQGKRYEKACRTQNKIIAKSIEAKFLREIEDDLYFPKGEKVLFSVVMGKMIEDSERKTCPKAAIQEMIHFFGKGKTMDEISTRDIQDYYNFLKERDLSSGTIIGYLTFIKKCFKYCKKYQIRIQEVMYPEIEPPKHRLRYLSFEEEQRLLDELTPDISPPNIFNGDKQFLDIVYQSRKDNFDFVVLLLDTGLRYSEGTNIEWKHIDLKNRSISVFRTKTKTESLIPMTKRLQALLTNRHANPNRNHKWVFPGADGIHPRSKNATVITNALKRAGIKGISCHSFRHTYASRLVQSGVSLFEVSKLLGHKTMKMTERYSHLSQDSLIRSVNVLDKVMEQNQLGTSSLKRTGTGKVVPIR